MFEYIGAGTIAPQFLIDRLYKEENRKLEIDFIDLKYFYRNKESLTENDLKNFIEENKDQLKVEYLDFNYAILNPKKLLDTEEFNQSFFDKIDQIEIDIANGVEFNSIVNNLNIKPIKIENFKFSSKMTQIEKKIFELRNDNFDIFENGDDYILFKIDNIEQREPDLNDDETKKEIVELVSQKNKFDYNSKLIKKIRENKFNDKDFLGMGKDRIKNLKLNSVKDNKTFEINSVKILYSLPKNSFTLINDEKNNIYLAKVKNFEDKTINDTEKLKTYKDIQNSNMKNSMLKSYDLYLSEKYNVVLNQKTIERVKNFFQ